MEKKVMEKAKGIFDRLVIYMEKEGWHPKIVENDSVFHITASARGDDLPMDFSIRVDAKRQVLSVLSYMPFVMDKTRLIEGAVATSVINYVLAVGCFDYDIQSGSIIFRISTSWKNSQISDDVFEYLLMSSAYTIDKYNDKMLMVSKGIMSLDDFYKFVHSDE